jgi:nicotinate-nucleotide adenylyltransferase
MGRCIMAEAICLLGGTFDPVHHGHLIVARAVAEAKGFSRITLIPANNPPHKPPARAPADDRLEMLKLAIEGDTLFDVRDLELKRPGPSYTLDTLKALRQQWPAARLHWIIGADMLGEVSQWHRVEEVLELATLLVADRPVQAPRPAHPSLAETRVCRPVPGEFLHTPLIDISSTDIRARVHQGQSIRYLVPDAVARYIADRGLYRDADPPPRPQGDGSCPR